MSTHIKPSEQLALLGSVHPQSVASGATVTTGWVSASKFGAIMAMINTGALGTTSTVDAKLEQATTVAGAGQKDIAGSAMTQLVKTGGENSVVFTQAMCNIGLDHNNGYQFVRASVTVGVASAFISASLLGCNPVYSPCNNFNVGVVQIVG